MKYTKARDFRQAYLTSNKLAMGGKRLVDTMKKTGSIKKLAHLLRHHLEEPINNDETWNRDKVDYLLEYFSMMCLAWITGYLKKEDIEELRKECLNYLGEAAIYRYYSEHYILLLPQLLYHSLRDNIDLSIDSGSGAVDEFLEFHQLNQTIDNDDTNQFLWFLDGGRNDGFRLKDIRDVLRNPDAVFDMLQEENKDDALHECVRGFFDYLQFADQLDLFLRKTSNPLHRSAYWYYHEYWFSKIGKKLMDAVENFFEGIPRNDIDGNLRRADIKAMDEYRADLQGLVFNKEEKLRFETYFRNRMGGWRT